MKFLALAFWLLVFSIPISAIAADAEGEAGAEIIDPVPQTVLESDIAKDIPARGEKIEPLKTIELGHVFTVVSGGIGQELPLSIGEMVRMALENNPEIKIQRLEPELGQTEIRRSWGRFDPAFSFQSLYSQSNTPQNAQQFIATGGDSQTITPLSDPWIFASEEFTMNWQIGGLTPLGTQYAFSINQLQARNDINIQTPPSLFYPEITTFAGITLTQPLLKNFGFDANMAGVRISRLQKRIGWFEWEKQLIRGLSEALYRYFDLAFAHENLRVRTEAVRAARLLEQQNIQRVEEGRMRPSDAWEAQASLSFNVDLALRAMNTLVEAQNSLKAVILTEQMALSGEFGRVVPLSPLDVPALEIDRSRFISEALGNRPEYLQIVSRAEQEGIRVRFARNQVLPTVNFQGSVGYTGLEGDYGNSFTETFSGQGVAFSAGVVVSIPIGNNEALATLEAAKLRKKQTEIAIQKAVTDLSIEVDTSISLLETSRIQVGTARDTAIAAGKTARAEEKLLEEGKSTTFEVVRLQNNASDARSRELAAVATYRKNAIRLAVARGMLLHELGVNVDKEALKTSLPGNRKKPDLPPKPGLETGP